MSASVWMFYIFETMRGVLTSFRWRKIRFNSIPLSISSVSWFFPPSSFLPLAIPAAVVPQESLSPSIFVCLKNSRRSTRVGGGVMAVLPLKCYLNDKVVWLRSLRGVILYTFTRLHWETGAAPPRVWFTPATCRDARRPAEREHASPAAPCVHTRCMHVTVTYRRARVRTHWTASFVLTCTSSRNTVY